VRIVADTNVLLRLVLADDPEQYATALEAVKRAEAVVVTNVSLCELVWTLRNSYSVSREAVAAAVSDLRATAHVVLDNAAVDAGLAMLRAGADFADGVIAHEGRCLGGGTFVSFDKKAVAVQANHGHPAQLLM